MFGLIFGLRSSYDGSVVREHIRLCEVNWKQRKSHCPCPFVNCWPFNLVFGNYKTGNEQEVQSRTCLEKRSISNSLHWYPTEKRLVLRKTRTIKDEPETVWVVRSEKNKQFRDGLRDWHETGSKTETRPV